jgi:hypothetical protein
MIPNELEVVPERANEGSKLSYTPMIVLYSRYLLGCK